MSISTVPGTSSKFTFACAECMFITGHTVDSYWPEVGPLLQRFTDSGNGELAVMDILKFVQEEKMQLFCMHTGGDIRLVAITEFIQYPQMKVLRIVGWVGENPLIAFKFMPGIEDWAKANGADFIETFATERMHKFAQRMGGKDVYTLMRKALNSH